MLLQYPDNLFFAEAASLHHLSPQLENRLTKNTGLFRGAGHLQHGLRDGIVVIPRILIGMLLTITLASYAAGSSIDFVLIVELVGIAVLVFMASKLWTRNPVKLSGEDHKAKDASALLPSFLISLLNPKWLVFYLVIVPDFVDMDVAQFTTVGLVVCTFICLATLNISVWIALAASFERRVKFSSRLLMTVNRIGSVSMVFIAASIGYDIVT